MFEPELSCIECGEKYLATTIIYHCKSCKGLLEISWPESYLRSIDRNIFDQRRGGNKLCDRSGVWRFREVLPPVSESDIISHPEGNTNLYRHKKLASYAGIHDLAFKHEGLNPSGSFKDRGMSVAISWAKKIGQKKIACASTGNTSASLASYAALASLSAFVFIPSGKISSGKLAQSLGFGARVLSVQGDFDVAMQLVQDLAERGLIYMVNSLNPLRIEGQKTIIWELLQDLNWISPDWIVVPGGNLGNCTAFGKALLEAKTAGWISKIPKIAVIQAACANPFEISFKKKFTSLVPMQAKTIATAIQIGNPVNFSKAKKVVSVVRSVSDEEILEAKGEIDRAGIGCEPASACALAGAKKLRAENIISENETVVGILTGHMLKDQEATLLTALKAETLAASTQAIIQQLNL